MDTLAATEAGMSDIHEAIGQWHDDSTNKQELHEYLGMTWEQYARWAELGELPHGSPFAEVTAQDLSYPPVAHVHLLPNPKGHNTMNRTDILGYIWTDPRTGEQHMLKPSDVIVVTAKPDAPITVRVEDETSSCSCGWHEHPSSEGWMVRTLGLKDPACPLHGKGEKPPPFGIRVIEDPSIPPDTFYAIGSCSCGHGAVSHTREGCQVVYGFAGAQCPCAVDVAQLATKTTGIGDTP
jgi:hypothetical protein